MTFIKDAKKIWHRLWSVRLALFSALIAVAQTCFDLYTSGTPHMTVIIAGLLGIAGAVSRLVDQPSLHGNRKTKKQKTA